MKRVALLVLISMNCFGQEDPSNVLEKSFYNVSFLINHPIGSYKENISSNYTTLNSGGLTASYLFNPLYKQGKLSSIFVGGEFGFFGNKQVDFLLPAKEGDFYMNHRQIWTNFKFRYLPNLVPKQIIPYLEAGVGPRFFTSKMMENYGDSQVTKVFGYSNTSLNYNLEFGGEYKLRGKVHPISFFDFSIGINQTNPLKIIDRNRVGFTQNFDVLDVKKSVQPQNFYFKFGLTSYL